MKLTILNVAYPLVPVSPGTAGGAEQIVAAIDRGLTLRGHHSVVLAAKNSQVHGTLIPTPSWDGRIDPDIRAWAASEHRRALSALLESIQVDLVHLHGLDFIEYLPPEPAPCMATLHLPPDWYPGCVFQLARRNMMLTCVSAAQRARMPEALLPSRTICHGIDTELFDRRFRKSSYAAMIGRICPEKGFHWGIDAARRAGVPLLIAGDVFPYEAHQRYFEEQIRPRLDKNVRFLGHANLRRKRHLLSAARCVLIPSLAAETSSLVAMEALACGTPVIAFRRGALPEIVDHGSTGFLVNDAAEMAEAIAWSRDLDPAACRRAARLRFSWEPMIQEYIDTYTEMIVSARKPPRAACAAKIQSGGAG